MEAYNSIVKTNNKFHFKTVDICYRYDGSFYGALSCVFESFEKCEMPVQIVTNNDFSLFRVKHIETDEVKAKRILKAIPAKIGSEALEYVKLIFLTKLDTKEISLIHFLCEGFKHRHRFIQKINTGFGPCRNVIAGALENINIAKIHKAVDLLLLEAQRFIQFVRFSDIGGALVSIIEPENSVLSLLAEHFAERYPNEQFLIYDKTHRLGLLYTDKQIRLEQIEKYEMPVLSQEEKDCQKLWRLFYDTIAIKERRNERCRMNFMPKKYWKNMTEFLKD